MNLRVNMENRSEDWSTRTFLALVLSTPAAKLFGIRATAPSERPASYSLVYESME